MSTLYYISLIYLTLGVVIILLGFIILKENTKQRINRITGIMMLFAGAGPLFAAFGFLMQHTSPDGLDLTPYRRIFVFWEFFFPQMLLFALVFPREIKWPKSRPAYTWIIFLPHIVHCILTTIFSSHEQIHNLINLDSLSDKFGIFIQPFILLVRLSMGLLELIVQFHTNFFALINLLYIVAAVTLMMLGQRRIDNPKIRKQVGWVLWGIRASLGLYAIAFIFPHLKIIQPNQTLTYILTVTALVIGAGSIGWAIIRYQFLNIRFMIRRGLIVSLTFGILIGLYLLIYSQGKKLMATLLGVEIPILEILFIILSLLGFQPLLSGVENFLERLFMKDQSDYRNVLKNLTEEIMSTLNLNDLRTKLTSTLERVMSLERVILLLPGPGTLLSVEIGSQQWAIRLKPDTLQLLVQTHGPMRFDDLALRTVNDEAVTRLGEMNPHWVLPLIYRHQLNGLLLLSQSVSRTVFSLEDITVLSVLANQAAIAIENVGLYHEALEKKRMEQELNFAKEIQRHLLPPRHIENDSMEICGYNLPSKEVGGDYYDFLLFDESRTGIAIGDISGKGVPAAILMSNLQAALRLCAEPDAETHLVMDRINNHIAATTSADRFATFFYGVYNHRERLMKFTNAGHNYPIHMQQNKPPCFIKSNGIIIGVRPNFPFESHRLNLNSGDVIVFYTDGITEAMNPQGDQYSEERLLETVAAIHSDSAQLILDQILDSVTEFTHGCSQSDDLTLVVFRVKS